MMENAGFKLNRFEVYNWGTFDETVWIVEPKNFSALLTGENGSGKSTLVDALLTLLVPNVKRNYNLASGNEKKERTELTYVRGAYAREQNELGGSQTKFLRKDNNYSVLLARFQNDLTRESITLGQFFWFENAALHKLFFVTHSQISIQENFSQIKNSKDVKNRLKHIPQTTVFSTFTEYQAYFIRYVGLRSEKGLDLFNQITAIKEINRLNEFVRKHMLNANETQELLNSLYTNYQNLELAYRAILNSKNQLEELNPLVGESKRFDVLQGKLNQSREEQKKLPYYFAHYKKEALNQKKSHFSRVLTENEAELKTTEFKLHSMNEQRLELTRLFSQDETGQELERLKLILNQHEEKKTFIQKQANEYALLAKTLKLSEKPNLKEFSKNLENSKTMQLSLESQLIEFKSQHYTNKKEQDNASQKIEELTSELRSLKNRKNCLPMNLIHVRDELAQTLGIAPSHLPFIAELMKVNDAEWEGAIEKLLHSFALRMLVPADLYADACKYLNRKNIGIRLVFQKIDEQFSAKPLATNHVEPNKLFHKIEFKAKSSYAPWLKEQIIKNFDYVCVKDLSVFQKQFKAITPEGLVKHGASLNEKDDRFSIHDKSRFILGWDNQEKLDCLLKDVQTYQKQQEKAAQSTQSTERLIQRVEHELIALQALCRIKDYSSINWEPMASEIDKIKKRQTMLTDSHQKSGKIQKDLQLLENDIQKNQDSRDQFLKEAAITTNALQEAQRDIDDCEKVLQSFEEVLKSSDWLKTFMKKQKLQFKDLSFRDYSVLEKTAIDELNTQSLKAETEKQHVQMQLVKKMTQFKARFHEHTIDLDTTIDSISGYIDLQKKLQTESLPEHERRFRKLLNKSVMNDMAAFKSTLDLAYEDIEETIQELNRVLIGMSYSDNSYVQLQLTRARDNDIRDFHQLLKQVLSDFHSVGKTDADNETSFERIKALLDLLKSDERWCKKVTDVRNWAEFSVSEKNRDTHIQKNFYSDSAGLSGGQKAKLAFTILGSAIAHQYGLNLEGDYSIKKSLGSCFQFIVIDEAFSKSDEKNSRYAMNLFQNLGLQVMVVTPKDKIHVVEPYIHSIFLTYMNEGQDHSQVIGLPLEHDKKIS